MCTTISRIIWTECRAALKAVQKFRRLRSDYIHGDGRPLAGAPVNRIGFVALGVGLWAVPVMAQLYDNGPLATPGSTATCLPTGAVESEVQEGNSIAGWSCSQTAVIGGFHLADNFVVPPGETWKVLGFRLPMYVLGAGAPNINNVWVQVRNGPPNVGGTVIAGNMVTNRFDAGAFTDIYRFLNAACSTSRRVQDVRASLCVTLGPGTYWVEWSASGTGSNGPWSPPVTIEGQPGKPDADALQLTDIGWEAVIDPGTEAEQDFAFAVEGTTCYADCSGDGELTVGDFGCFQTAFVVGECYADCNGDGGLTVADFGCFQTKYVSGCP